ncbi:hypothetical protein PRCB_09220 [Pantoea rodasii]|uniref:Uncharacterized protein n=1 Tax=Pantoea rodasii TaxID=1076549 RepID=A0A2M9WEA1_9GAMM|nr:hypothetical protein [Pantoea rodasii]ORM61180.1 hypothetical protein HA45_21055 [Pantoea rodasii]PJZ05837.1 hypothetical protein PRCB_09220 [Pantoea rodasii]
MEKKLKHMELNALERDIFASQHNTLNLKLQHLAEEYAHLYDSYGKGLAEMGEQLLHHAEFLHHNRKNAEDVSWAGLLKELMRRSG